MRWDEKNKKLFADKRHIASLSAEDIRAEEKHRLLTRVINRYKILLSRAMKGTWIWVEEEPLRRQFQRLFA